MLPIDKIARKDANDSADYGRAKPSSFHGGAIYRRNRMPTTLTYATNPVRRVDVYPHQGAYKGDVLVLQGGNFTNTPDRGGKSADYANKLSKNGFRAHVADRRGLTWPTIMEDPRAVIDWLTAYFSVQAQPATKWGAWGWSSGATLAAWLAIEWKVQKAVVVSGPADMAPLAPNNPGIQGLCPTGNYDDASPALHIGPNTSPMFLLYGTQDTTIPLSQGEGLRDALAVQSIPDCVWYPYDGGHTLDGLTDTQIKPIRGAAFNWLAA